MRHQDGDIIWDVDHVNIDGHMVTEIRFRKQTCGEFKGHYHGMFWQLPMIFLSQFIDPEYKLWSAYLGEHCIGSNVVYVNGSIASTVEAKAVIEKFANS